MQLTTNYKFRKPAQTDNVNVDDLNYNMDIADAELKKVNTQLGEMEKYALRSQGSYVGDGVAGREIIVGFNPKYVCIMCFTNPTAGVIFVSLNREYSLRQLGSSTNQVQETRLSENGFYVGGTHNTANGIDNIYYYFIIG